MQFRLSWELEKGGSPRPSRFEGGWLPSCLSKGGISSSTALCPSRRWRVVQVSGTHSHVSQKQRDPSTPLRAGYEAVLIPPPYRSAESAAPPQSEKCSGASQSGTWTIEPRALAESRRWKVWVLPACAKSCQEAGGEFLSQVVDLMEKIFLLICHIDPMQYDIIDI